MSENQGDFDKVAHKSKQTVLWIQVGEAVLLGLAAVAIVVLVTIVINDHQTISRQQAALAKVTVAQVAEARRVSNALCDSQFTIGTAPLPPTATKLAVEFIAASRKAFAVLECKGNLGPPPKSLVALGRKLGVPIRY